MIVDPYRKPEEHTSERVKEWLRNTSVVAPWETEPRATMAPKPAALPPVAGRLLGASYPVMAWCMLAIAAGYAKDQHETGPALTCALLVSVSVLFVGAILWCDQIWSRK